MTRPPNRTEGARPSPHGDLRYWFAELFLITLTGRRPATRMVGLTSGEVYEKLWSLVEAGTLHGIPGAAHPRVLACRHCAPAPGVLEVSAVISAAGRPRALAFRLERTRDRRRWRCTALEVG